jgi:hypothetical protein
VHDHPRVAHGRIQARPAGRIPDDTAGVAGSGASGRRVSTVTSCPSASSSGISARPRTPRPPVTVAVAITAPPFNSPPVAPPPGAAGLRTSP